MRFIVYLNLKHFLLSLLFLTFTTLTAHSDADDYTVQWHPGPEIRSADGQFSFKTNGRMIYDYANVTFKDAQGINRPEFKVNDTEFRALEIGFRGKMFGNVNYRLVTRLLNGQMKVKFAYLDYEWGNLNLIAGQTRTFTGLEKSTPSTNTSFSARASFFNILRAKPHLGIALSYHGEDWSINGGYYFGHIGVSEEIVDDHKMITTRLNYSPRFDNGIGLHFGTSHFYRYQNDNGFDYNYDDRPFSHQGDYKPLFSEILNITSEQFHGLEFVAYYKSFALQSEFGILKNKLSPTQSLSQNDPTYEGGYLEVSYFPTGGARTVDGTNGKFNHVQVNNPVGQGGIGEIKLAARFAQTDLRHENFGRKQSNYIVGTDWYFNQYMKLQANYAHTKVRDYSGLLTDSINSFNLRYQIFW